MRIYLTEFYFLKILHLLIFSFFFRRAHQKTKAPQFVCKRMNSCEITVKTRRRCQKCRYDLCLKIGMKPEAVLTEDQRKVRFRNAIKKKEARNTQNISREFIGKLKL